MPSPSASNTLAALVQEFLTSMYETHPTVAASLGLHVYDGRVPDLSEHARADRAAALRAQARRAAALPETGLGRDDRHDATLLRLAIDEELFELESLRDFERNPIAYAGAIDVSNYVKRDYAPFEHRLAVLIEHLRQIPDVLANARTTLRSPLPRPFVDTALDVYAGTVTYHEGELPAAVQAAGAGEAQGAFERANNTALGALRGFIQYLTDDLRPRATAQFAIGEDRFRTMLRLGEMVDVDLDRLLEIGRRDLDENTQRLRAACEIAAPGMAVRDAIKRQGADHPPADRLIEEAARVLDELRAFVEDRGIVTIPSDVRCRVEPTPPFLRWAFAMMDTAGPFEPSSDSFYYVTPPEPGWTAAQTEEWLTKFDYATLRDVGTHEVYPGHYVHFLHVREIKRPLRQVLTSYAFVEGWAHDAEQLMLRRLREDVRTRDGARYDLRTFNDTLLGLGAPPLPLARRTLIGDDGSPVL